MSGDDDIKKVPFLDLNVTERSLEMEKRPDGSILMRAGLAPASYPDQISYYLRKWDEEAPDRVFLAERDGPDSWRELTYGQARDMADRVSQGLLDRGHGPDRPIASLGGTADGGNCIDMGILKLAAMQVGIPFMPISPGYSLMSEDFAKLKYIFTQTEPSLVFIPDRTAYGKALAAVEFAGADITEGLGDLAAAEPGASFHGAYDSVTPDSMAKILFTSGSTGMPKSVITTQCMLCFNTETKAQVMPFLDERPQVFLDWMPWNHVAGGNVNFNLTLHCGGTLYIDEGKPQPEPFKKTLRNLRDIQPTAFISIPLVYDMLVPHLEADDAFCHHVLEKMDFLFYAGAPLPSSLWDRLEVLSVKARGKRIPFFSSLGATETAPSCTFCNWPSQVSGNLGLPVPGVEIKLAPTAGKLEMRVKGPNVTPGYYKDDETTRAAFDEEGFYCMGDALRFVDEDRPEEGLLFDGRISENFKLMTGTWVQTGTLRTDAITAMAPYVQDVAVAGDGEREVGLLVFPTVAGRDKESGELRGELQAGLRAHNEKKFRLEPAHRPHHDHG
ncbi:MAG: AMP-binding protein [Rhodospirillales bacterium]|nr:AMP-binding protein [Rhodospirillales bacterium]